MFSDIYYVGYEGLKKCGGCNNSFEEFYRFGETNKEAEKYYEGLDDRYAKGLCPSCMMDLLNDQGFKVTNDVEDFAYVKAGPLLVKTCKRFIEKVENGQARSVESYAQCKDSIEAYEDVIDNVDDLIHKLPVSHGDTFFLDAVIRKSIENGTAIVIRLVGEAGSGKTTTLRVLKRIFKDNITCVDNYSEYKTDVWPAHPTVIADGPEELENEFVPVFTIKCKNKYFNHDFSDTNLPDASAVF